MLIGRILLFLNAVATIGLVFLLLQHESFLPPNSLTDDSNKVKPHSSEDISALNSRETVVQSSQPPCPITSPTIHSIKILESEDQDFSNSLNHSKEVESFEMVTFSWPKLLPPKEILEAARISGEDQCNQLKNNSPVKPCQVYYMHTHKSGGSTLCSLAALNGYTVDISNNCQEMSGSDRVTWWKWSSWQQAKLFRDSPHNFISNEDNPFIDPPLPGQFLYIMTVRHPLDRILSHFRHHRKDHKLSNFSFATFSNYFPEPADYWASNWYVQLLGGGGGGGCFGRGSRCDSKELNLAIARLRTYFSLILITDTSLHFRVGGLLLREKFGWMQSSDTDKARRGTHVESRAVSELAPFPLAYAHLVSTNALDMQFYDEAISLFQESVQRLFLAHVTANKKFLTSLEVDDLFELMAIKKGPTQPTRSSSSGSRPSAPKKTIPHAQYHGLSASPQSSGSSFGELGEVVKDRSGFGGHTDLCKGMGILSVKSCRSALLRHTSCTVLSYKDSKCFLHDKSVQGFYTDNSPGHWIQTKKSAS